MRRDTRSRISKLIRCPICGGHTIQAKSYVAGKGFVGKFVEPRHRYCPECMWNVNPLIEPKTRSQKWRYEEEGIFP